MICNLQYKTRVTRVTLSYPVTRVTPSYPRVTPRGVLVGVWFGYGLGWFGLVWAGLEGWVEGLEGVGGGFDIFFRRNGKSSKNPSLASLLSIARSNSITLVTQVAPTREPLISP